MTVSASSIIGVFDSGFGGLTVLRALLPLFPGAHFIYLGDTARLPYGAKSRETITRYALSSAQFLLSKGIELLVVACNTASALALDELEAALPIPVLGVIAPGTAAAARETGEDGGVLVLATAATVQSHAYRESCARAGLQAFEKSCPLLVPLVEEGWIDHPVTREVLRIYLAEALQESPRAQTLLLGCTHYPLLQAMIRETLDGLGTPLRVIDSARATAEAARALLPPTHEQPASRQAATCSFYATDSIEKFQRLGSRFLGQPLPEVHLIDLGG